MTSLISHRRDPGSTGRSPQHAFTLVEILSVLGVIAVLIAITIATTSGVSDSAGSEKARAELAIFADALEKYRAHYGEYPQFPDAPMLFFDALNGKLTPDGDDDAQRPFASLDGLRVDDDMTRFLDPWGSAYVYFPFESGNREGYRLYSSGPDLRDWPPNDDGVINTTHEDNLDNIYAHL
ncbi:MAG: hypothetical protein SynsKO_26070 [Synoicihabitans sp.]